EVVLAEPALEERAGVDAGGGVVLDEDLVAAGRVVLAVDEGVEAHVEERGAAGARRAVPAEPAAGRDGAGHHGRGAPGDGRRGGGLAHHPIVVLRGDTRW